jgi:hypothetical protein
MLSLVLVVNFMGLPKPTKIPVIHVVKPLESPVNKDVMDQEVGYTVVQDSQSNGNQYGIGGQSNYDARTTGNRKNDKEQIILFKEPLTWLVVVFMEIPEESVHDIPMRQPGDSFHGDQGE